MNNKILPPRISKIAFPEILGAPSVKKKKDVFQQKTAVFVLLISLILIQLHYKLKHMLKLKIIFLFSNLIL